MSNFVRAAYHPEQEVVRAGLFLDDYFGRHQYGVQFGDDVFPARDCEIPLDTVFVSVEEPEGTLKRMYYVNYATTKGQSGACFGSPYTELSSEAVRAFVEELREEEGQEVVIQSIIPLETYYE